MIAKRTTVKTSFYVVNDIGGGQTNIKIKLVIILDIEFSFCMG